MLIRSGAEGEQEKEEEDEAEERNGRIKSRAAHAGPGKKENSSPSILVERTKSVSIKVLEAWAYRK